MSMSGPIKRGKTMSHSTPFIGVALIALVLALGNSGAAAVITWSLAGAAMLLAALFALMNYEPRDQEESPTNH